MNKVAISDFWSKDNVLLPGFWLFSMCWSCMETQRTHRGMHVFEHVVALFWILSRCAGLQCWISSGFSAVVLGCNAGFLGSEIARDLWRLTIAASKLWRNSPTQPLHCLRLSHPLDIGGSLSSPLSWLLWVKSFAVLAWGRGKKKEGWWECRRCRLGKKINTWGSSMQPS